MGLEPVTIRTTQTRRRRSNQPSSGLTQNKYIEKTPKFSWLREFVLIFIFSCPLILKVFAVGRTARGGGRGYRGSEAASRSGTRLVELVDRYKWLTFVDRSLRSQLKKSRCVWYNIREISAAKLWVSNNKTMKGNVLRLSLIIISLARVLKN